MSQSARLALGILAAVLAIGPSCAAAQSAHLDATTGAHAGRAPLRAELQSTPRTWQSPPQQVGRNRTRGALWGGGIGFVAGGLVTGLTSASDDEGGFGSSLTESALTGEAVLLGAVFGAGIGAILGATLFAPSHRSASDDGGGLALSIHPSRSIVAVSGRVRIGR